MKLTSTVISLVALVSFASTVSGDPLPVIINSAYDDSNRPLDTVSCNDHLSSLNNKFKTYGSLPTFPNVAGISYVTGPSSWACGTCWKVTFQSNSVYVLAIGHVKNGVELSTKTMNTLTNGMATKLAWAEVVQAENSMCGM